MLDRVSKVDILLRVVTRLFDSKIQTAVTQSYANIWFSLLQRAMTSGIDWWHLFSQISMSSFMSSGFSLAQIVICENVYIELTVRT